MTTFTAGNRSQGVRGTTIINHRIRIKLGLSMEEYCVLDAFYEIKLKNLPMKFSAIFERTGIQHNDVPILLSELRDRGFIELKNGKNFLTKKWNQEFDVDATFETFWEVYQKRGNKQESKIMYQKALKLVDTDTLLTAASKYVESVTEWQKIMHAQRFLNPKNKHWEDEIESPGASQKIYNHK